jgi:hypothetical protein
MTIGHVFHRGPAESGPRFTIVQQESDQGITAGGGRGRVGGRGWGGWGRGVRGGRGVFIEDWTGAWISTALNTHVVEDCFFHYRQHSI